MSENSIGFDTPFVYDDFFNTKMYNRGTILTNDELIDLRKWASHIISNNMLDVKNNIMIFELDERNNVVNPLVFEIRSRIEKKEQLVIFERDSVVKDNLIVIPKNGSIHKHTDPNDLRNGLFHVRFNVFISTGISNTYYDGQLVDTTEGCYVLCRSGIDPHWTDMNELDYNRISLSFGYLLTVKEVDRLTQDPKIGTYLNNYPLTNNICLSHYILFNSIVGNIEIEEKGYKGSGILTVSNIISDIQCGFLIRYMNNNSSLWTERDVYTGSGNNVACKFICLNNMIASKINYSIQVDDFIYALITVILKKLVSLYPDFKGTQDDGYTLRKIYGGTKLHCDGVSSTDGGFKKFIRCLSLIIVLNDDYDGGIFNFPNQGLKLKVKKGEAIMFPPYWTHPHSVTSVGEGQARYTINTWILEKFID
jgi:hypothetical protein